MDKLINILIVLALLAVGIYFPTAGAVLLFVGGVIVFFIFKDN